MIKACTKNLCNQIRKILLYALDIRYALLIVAVILVTVITTLAMYSVNTSLLSNSKEQQREDDFKENYNRLFRSISEDDTDIKDSSFPYISKLNEIEKGRRRVDIGEDFIKGVINNNNRLDYYELYIRFAKQKGYIITSYIDYLKKYKNTNKKVMILRHDIDVYNDANRYMFEIEKRNNVKATYYFRWDTFDKKLIGELSRAGFEVGFHYETIAEFYKKNHLSRITQEDIEKCREILKKEIIEFKEKSGINIETIASHGNPINKIIAIPNNVLLQYQNYRDYGIVSEIYDANIQKNYIKAYICDGDILYNSGFSYKANPIDSILNNDKVIEFLSHPNHWNYNFLERINRYIDFESGDYVL